MEKDLFSKEERENNRKTMAAVMFNCKRNKKWVENGCDVCHKGMTKRIYDFQREHRKEGTICSTCDKKQRLKDDTREIIN